MKMYLLCTWSHWEYPTQDGMSREIYPVALFSSVEAALDWAFESPRYAGDLGKKTLFEPPGWHWAIEVFNVDPTNGEDSEKDYPILHYTTKMKRCDIDGHPLKEEKENA